MANSTIPNLVAVTVPALTDLFGVRQSGDTRDKKLTASQLLSLVSVPDPLLLGAGTVGAPTYSFSGDPDTGVFNTAADQLSLAVGGVELIRFVEGVGIEQALILNNDNTGLPDLASLGDPDTGWSWDIANGMYWNGGGSRAWNFSTVKFNSQFSDGPAVVNAAAGLTIPTLLPDQADADTGLGGNGADVLSLIAGAKEIARCQEVVGAEQFIVSPGFVENNAALPALAFGNADTGFFESVDNTLQVSVGGVASFQWSGTIFRANTGLGAAMQNESASATNPTLIPSVQDQDSGIGSNAIDQVSIIGGGVELARFVEVVGSEQALILNNDNTGLPDLGSLGDVDTGLNWDIANGMYVVLGTIRQYNWSSTSYFGQNSSGPLMSNVAASLTVPTFCANRSDLTSGLGGDSGAAALVASSITGLAVRAANGNTMPSWNADLTVTAFATGGQTNATQLDAGHNVISTVATTGDSVKLLPIFLAGSVVYIKNNGANAADVFPHIGGNLGAGLNTAVSLAAGASISFIATTANSIWTQWIVSVGGGGGDVTKVGTPVNNQVGIWTGDGTLEGDADLVFDGTILTTGLTGRIRTGVGTPTTPAFSFATETNTGIYRQGTGSLGISLSGAGNWLFQAASFFANVSAGPQLMFEAATATNPTLIPRLSDTDSGIGSGAADEVNLIAGGLSCMSVRETAAARQIGFYVTAPISLQTGVAVTAGAIHAALVALGLITA